MHSVSTDPTAPSARTDSPGAEPRLPQSVQLNGAESATAERVVIDGKHFALAGRRFAFRGVTYGTFRPRPEDGAHFPEPRTVDADFRAISRASFTIVRTYAVPPPDVLTRADRHGLRILPDIFYLDWRYMFGSSRRAQRRLVSEAAADVRTQARRLAGDGRLIALSLGNEIPADVVRWVGTRRVSDVLAQLAEAVKDEDPDQLITYANYPTAEYLPLEHLDFLTFNVFLEDDDHFRSYLSRLQHLAGDRPLVLGEIGLDSGGTPDGEARQAEALEWQLRTTIERGLAGACVFSWTDEWWVGDQAVEGWHFGLTRADRSPRPALGVAERWNRATVAAVQEEWPSISVVICAYNAAQTLDECLRHTCALDYPDLEVIVVDDGSTDETARIARRHPRARLVSIHHRGLSTARNEGCQAAGGELIAFLDSDAYPTPEWPYYLALGFDGTRVAGAGGPNVPPPDDSRGAHVVARAPGGPLQVMLSDTRAEHVPGCNMAFWRYALRDVGGFDPVYTSAGDDVDMCWKVLDRDWEIGFHPAALVWHHARGGIRSYVRQQRGYGQAEALVEARHPHRFTGAGTARWRGHIYDSFPPRMLRQRVYRGVFGAAAYQSIYHGRGDGRTLLHQVGVPAAALVLPTAALALISPILAIPAVAALAFLSGLLIADIVAAQPPRRVSGPFRFRCAVAWLSLLQPLARTWGRLRHRAPARRGLGPESPLPSILAEYGGVIVLPEDRPREAMAATIVAQLRSRGVRVEVMSGWADHDARLLGSSLVLGKLVTSRHPVGCIQVRIDRWPRARGLLGYSVAGLVALLLQPWVAAGVLALALAEVLRGLWRTGRGMRRVLES
jgi:glycosyltransferase involved in cell wall biosynthesis